MLRGRGRVLLCGGLELPGCRGRAGLRRSRHQGRTCRGRGRSLISNAVVIQPRDVWSDAGRGMPGRCHRRRGLAGAAGRADGRISSAPVVQEVPPLYLRCEAVVEGRLDSEGLPSLVAHDTGRCCSRAFNPALQAPPSLGRPDVIGMTASVVSAFCKDAVLLLLP